MVVMKYEPISGGASNVGAGEGGRGGGHLIISYVTSSTEVSAIKFWQRFQRKLAL